MNEEEIHPFHLNIYGYAGRIVMNESFFILFKEIFGSMPMKNLKIKINYKENEI